MNQLAWLIPTYPPRRDLVLQLIESYNNTASNVDLVLVFTQRKENFVEDSGIRFIYLEDRFSPTDISLFEKSGSIINVKKLMGLQEIMGEYKGIIVTDDELEFIREFNGHELLEVCRSRAHYPATNITDSISKDKALSRVLLECSKMLPSEEERILIRDSTRSFSLLSWFSDLPFYDCSDLPEFFSRYGLNNTSGYMKLSYFTFDHVLYQFHKIIRRERDYIELDWQYKSPKIYNWFECLHIEPLNEPIISEYVKAYNPLWVSGKNLVNLFPNAIAIFHKDREFSRQSRWLLIKHALKIIVTTLIPKANANYRN